jgi:hypothetical protein
MRPSTFVTLAAVTGISVAAAVTAATMETDNTAATAGEPFLPRIAGGMDDIASITIQSNNDTTTVRRDGEKWVLTGDLDGYPASPLEIRDLLVGLGDIRRLEPKTALEDRFEKLQVNDVTEDDALGERVTVMNADGEKLADLIIGKAWFGNVGLDKTGRYVRSLDEDRAWLVVGDLAAGARVRDVVDPKIVPVVREEDIRRVTVSHPDGEEVIVERDMPTKQFVLIDKPEDRDLRTPTTTASFAKALQDMTLQNILPASAVPMDDTKAVLLAAETFTGETIVLRIQADNERHVVAVESLHKAGREADEKAGLKRADWRYVVPEWRFDDLTKRMEDMLVKPSS